MSTASDVDHMASAGGRSVDRKDLFAGALVTVAGAALFVNALSMEVRQAGNQQIGPDVFPLAISGLMAALGLLLIGKSLLRTRELSPTPVEPHVSDEIHHVVDEVHELMDEPPVPFRRLLVVLAIFVAYLVLLIPAGFILSTALFMTAMTSFVAPDKWLRNVLVAVGTSVVVYYCFSSLLGVELPAGLLGW